MLWFMNCELEYLSNWFHANFLSLNSKKTNYIIFTGPKNKMINDTNKNIVLNNVAIKRVSSVKFLGVIIIDEYAWPHQSGSQNDWNYQKAHPSLICSIQCFHFALSELQNNSMGWGLLNAAPTYSPTPKDSCTPLQPIHILQKRAVRLIMGVHYNYLSRTPRLFESFGILTVFDLGYINYNLVFLCTIIKDAFCLLYLMTTSVQMPLFVNILLDPSLEFMLFYTKSI